jgi:hypothetical protein
MTFDIFHRGARWIIHLHRLWLSVLLLHSLLPSITFTMLKDSKRKAYSRQGQDDCAQSDEKQGKDLRRPQATPPFYSSHGSG